MMSRAKIDAMRQRIRKWDGKIPPAKMREMMANMNKAEQSLTEQETREAEVAAADAATQRAAHVVPFAPKPKKDRGKA